MQPAPRDPDALDERALRSAQAVVALVLLAGFVFRVPLLIPIVALVVAAGAILGPRANPFVAGYNALVGPRLHDAGPTVPASSARALDVGAVALLVIAALALLVGLEGFAWILALVEAAVAAIAASTGYNAAVAVTERFRRE